ncbi:PilZ domain-containing protein, partial [Patescibacteria group bacterium]|nr:PilZ domain-containing protein [Patescibacteria group bacterium]
LNFEEEAFGLPEKVKTATVKTADREELIEIPEELNSLPDQEDINLDLNIQGNLDINIETDLNFDLKSDIKDTPNFRIEVNCLMVGEMSESDFMTHFDKYYFELFSSGDQLYIDFSEYGMLEGAVALRAIKASFEAVEKNKKLSLRLLKDQYDQMNLLLPKLEKVKKQQDTTPRFVIEGSKMEIHHVDMDLFLEKFSENFKNLMRSNSDKIFVDISHLEEVSPRAIELIVLCYLEAVGNGLSMVLRISPDMEEGFLKSGRGRTLPLEIIRPEASAKAGLDKSRKYGIDMSKINSAIEQDKLGQKILEQNYASVHIESRGTIGNWEPVPMNISAEKEIDYTGPERRIEKRYKTNSIEVLFARGSLAKIGGRPYTVHNISNSGLCFTSAVSLTKKEPIRLKIIAENTSAEVSGKVIWTKPVPAQALFKVGVEFTKIGEVSKSQLREIIRTLYIQ